MNTYRIADDWANNLVEKSKLSGEEMKTLYSLLSKMDISEWSGENLLGKSDFEKHPEKAYGRGVSEFFRRCLNDFVIKNFGEGLFDLMWETPTEDFKKNPFIKILKQQEHSEQVTPIGKVLEKLNSIDSILNYIDLTEID